MTTSEPNIDAAEVRKFTAFDQDWWDPKGKLKALHDINGLRLSFIETCSPLEDCRVLDMGCGGGILAEAMAANGATVTGIDISRSALAAARAHAQKSGLAIDYRHATVEEMANNTSGRFDLVTCMELLEHVPDPGAVVYACSRLVRDGGSVVFATLNRNLKSFVFAILGAEYILGLVPKGTHSFRKFIKPAELKRWAESSGLMSGDITGLHYNPFFGRYALGGNLHVNYMAHFTKP